jgi:hypothetical protein
VAAKKEGKKGGSRWEIKESTKGRMGVSKSRGACEVKGKVDERVDLGFVVVTRHW